MAYLSNSTGVFSENYSFIFPFPPWKKIKSFLQDTLCRFRSISGCAIVFYFHIWGIWKILQECFSENSGFYLPPHSLQKIIFFSPDFYEFSNTGFAPSHTSPKKEKENKYHLQPKGLRLIVASDIFEYPCILLKLLQSSPGPFPPLYCFYKPFNDSVVIYWLFYYRTI